MQLYENRLPRRDAVSVLEGHALASRAEPAVRPDDGGQAERAFKEVR